VVTRLSRPRSQRAARPAELGRERRVTTSLPSKSRVGACLLLAGFAALPVRAASLAALELQARPRLSKDVDRASRATDPHSDGGDASGYLTITDDPGAKRLILALGPIDLPAGTSHDALRQLPVQHGTIPFDFTIRGFRAEVVDAGGRSVPQAVIHHLNLLDPRSRELFLPIMRRVLALSHETKPARVPGWLFGIPMRSGDPFLALTMLHNPTDRSYDGVTVRLILEYERSERLPLYTLYPFHIDVMFPVGIKTFDLPPGRSTRSFEASPAVAGGIVGMGGHLHRYATSLALEDVTDRRVLYRIVPKVTPDGHIEEVPILRHRGKGLGALIYPDHVYRVTVTYDNPTGETIPDGGMASVAGGFVPLEEWPSADPSHPLYAEDYEDVIHSLDHGEATEEEAHDQ